MTVEITKDKKGYAIGWTLKGENKEEIGKLATIRNLQFFGMGETAVQYDGREGGDDKAGDPGMLKWKQKEHCK